MLPMMFTDSTLLLLCLFSFVVLFVGLRTQKSAKRLPPGPKGLPIFGNIFQIPRERLHVQFLQWAQQYGEIFHLKVGPGHIIVLNTAEAANELLANRSRIYSGRSPAHVAQDILSDGQRMVMMPYGQPWKVSRKGAQEAVGSNAARTLREIQELESRVLIEDLLNHGDQSTREVYSAEDEGVAERHWSFLIRRTTTSIVLTAMYGKRIYELQDGKSDVQIIFDIIENFTREAIPGKYLADSFAPLRLLPDMLAPWRVRAKKMHEWEMEFYGGLLDENKRLLKAGRPRNCFVSSYLSARTEHGYEDAPGPGLTADKQWMRDKLVAYTGVTVIGAGSDTTASALQSFILFMLANPRVLQRARQEIDRVVGTTRLPSFDDEKDLPYLVACIKETLRLRPPVIVGVPHRADEDDVYKGYFIPKGSIIFGNVWAIHMDPIKYPNPSSFEPDRFYNSKMPINWASGPEATGRDHYVFGWGRRYCVGSALAEASLFIICARIIWALDIYAPAAKGGASLGPDVGDEHNTWTSGLLSAPKLFSVGWKARDEQRRALVQRAFQEAQAEWSSRRLEQDVR